MIWTPTYHCKVVKRRKCFEPYYVAEGGGVAFVPEQASAQ